MRVPVVLIWHRHRFFDKASYRAHAKHLNLEPWSAGPLPFRLEDDKLFLGFHKTLRPKQALVLDCYTPQAFRFVEHRLVPDWFDLRLEENHEFNLYTLPTQGILHGYPIRKAGYRLAQLEAGDNLWICINGRTWHSATGRRASLYAEYEFVYQYLGILDVIPQEGIETFVHELDTRHIPCIDLRKALY